MKMRLLLLLACSVALLRAASPNEAAIALFKTKHYPESREAFEKIATAEPNNAEAHYYLGMIAIRRSDETRPSASSSGPRRSLRPTPIILPTWRRVQPGHRQDGAAFAAGPRPEM